MERQFLIKKKKKWKMRHDVFNIGKTLEYLKIQELQGKSFAWHETLFFGHKYFYVQHNAAKALSSVINEFYC